MTSGSALVKPSRRSTTRPGVYHRVRRLTARDVPGLPSLVTECTKAASTELQVWLRRTRAKPNTRT
jgi:hypothetical protein